MTLLDVEQDFAEDHALSSERSALGRAQLLIDAFTPETPVLSLGALARKAHLPKSTAHRYVEQMVGLGWLERRHTGYRIGIKLYEMGELCERRNNLRRAATIHLVALTQRTGLSSYLSVIDQTTVLCLDRACAPVSEMPTRRAAHPLPRPHHHVRQVDPSRSSPPTRSPASWTRSPPSSDRRSANPRSRRSSPNCRPCAATGSRSGRRADRTSGSWASRCATAAGRSRRSPSPRRAGPSTARVIDLTKQAAVSIWNDLFPVRRPRTP